MAARCGKATACPSSFPPSTKRRASPPRSTISAALEAVDEVVVVDNNSRDTTAARAEAAGARVVREPRQGYGNALRRGLAEAQGEYVVLAEPDGTFMGKDVLKLLAYADDFDLVLGTRTTRELIWHGANMGWQLRWGNWVVAKLLQVLFDGPSLSDCGCTLRLVRRSSAGRLLPRFTVGGSHFLPEMVCLALLDRPAPGRGAGQLSGCASASRRSPARCSTTIRVGQPHGCADPALSRLRTMTPRWWHLQHRTRPKSTRKQQAGWPSRSWSS